MPWFIFSLIHSLALPRLEIINKCFSKRTVEEIISALVSLLQFNAVFMVSPVLSCKANIYIMSGTRGHKFGRWMGCHDNPVLEKGFTYQSENLSEIGTPQKPHHIYTISLRPGPQLCPREYSCLIFCSLTRFSDKRREDTNCWGVLAAGI